MTKEQELMIMILMLVNLNKLEDRMRLMILNYLQVTRKYYKNINYKAMNADSFLK